MMNLKLLKYRPDAGEQAYAYAKACGIAAKSFIGNRVRNLERVNRLSELDRMLFPASERNLPEKELLIDLEKRIVKRSSDSISSVMECFSKPPEFFILLFRGFDAEQNELEQDYYNALWKSLFRLPARDRQGAVRILSDEISLKNCCWALRLRKYYDMGSDEVKTHLINILEDDAIHSLEFPLDDFSPWSSWRWRRFLNPAPDERQWRAGAPAFSKFRFPVSG